MPCTLYAADLLITRNSTTGIFADDTIILAIHEDPIRAKSLKSFANVDNKNGKLKSIRNVWISH